MSDDFSNSATHLSNLLQNFTRGGVHIYFPNLELIFLIIRAPIECPRTIKLGNISDIVHKSVTCLSSVGVCVSIGNEEEAAIRLMWQEKNGDFIGRERIN